VLEAGDDNGGDEPSRRKDVAVLLE